jgi:hypothetical protein
MSSRYRSIAAYAAGVAAVSSCTVTVDRGPRACQSSFARYTAYACAWTANRNLVCPSRPPGLSNRWYSQALSVRSR